MAAQAKKKILMPIGVKITVLLAFLLLASIALVVWLSTRLFVQDNTALIQQITSDVASSRGTQVREYLSGLTRKIQLFGNVLIQHSIAESQRDQVLQGFFKTEKEVLAVFLHRHQQEEPKLKRHASSPALEEFSDSEGRQALKSLMHSKNFSIAEISTGATQIAPLLLADGSPSIAIGIPFIQDPKSPNKFTHTLTAVIRPDRLLETFVSDGVVSSFLVDHKGNIVAHPDKTRVTGNENIAHLSIVNEMLQGRFNNGQQRYQDPEENQVKLGAFRTVGFAGLGVVASVSEEQAFAAAQRVQYQSLLVAVIILCVALILGYFYSDSLTWPITTLTKAANEISEGNFRIKVKPRSRDEIGYLSETFNEMVIGLQERDRVKETFNKFHDKEIAEALLSGEVKLGGDKMEATIFFSDIRSFTSLSESMEPEDVVEMLNEYMSEMVAIIHKFGGVVDKYVGDAIMALWGVPICRENDTENAIKACLQMRMALAKLNDKRIARNLPALRIGMGLNRGTVVAGRIGSEEKMEYTVIGDAVNLASRIESITKTAGTDLLVSTSVKELAGNKFIYTPGGAIKVKGKATAVEVFTIPGILGKNGEEILLRTPYSSYTAEKSDKVESKDAA